MAYIINSVLHLEDYEIVAEIFSDSGLEVEYFDVNNKGSCDSIVSGMQLETENCGCQCSGRMATMCLS
jgi:hypothetical protein